MSPEVHWFESSHHDDEFSLLSEQDPPPKGGARRTNHRGRSSVEKKPIEMAELVWEASFAAREPRNR